MNTTEWAEALQEEVFKRWKEDVPNRWPEFKVFYNPIQDNPTIVIVGANPGLSGGKDIDNVPEELPVKDRIRRMEENKDFSPPDNHHLVTKTGELAEELRENLFLGDTDVIENSITMTNQWFLHSNEVDSIDTREYEFFNEFCETKSWEIITTLDPELVLCLREGVYDDLTNRAGLSTNDKELRHVDTPQDYRLYERADGTNRTIMRVVHPTSEHVKRFQGPLVETEWGEIRNQIGEFVTIQDSRHC